MSVDLDSEGKGDTGKSSMPSLQRQVRLPGVIVADKRGVVRSINDDALRVFGFQREEVVGRNVTVLMPPAYALQHDSYIERFLRTGRSKVVGTTRVVIGQRKSGEAVKASSALSFSPFTCWVLTAPPQVRLALSFMPDDIEPLISAMVEELVDHTFALRADHMGVILSVTGNPKVRSRGGVRRSIIILTCPVFPPSLSAHRGLRGQ